MNIQSICLVTFTGKANHFQAYMAVKRVSLRKNHKNILLQLQQKVETTVRKIILSLNHHSCSLPYFSLSMAVCQATARCSFSQYHHLAMHHFNIRGFDGITITNVDEVLLYIDKVKSTSQNCTSSIDSDKIWN
jgi:hypothetical protein